MDLNMQAPDFVPATMADLEEWYRLQAQLKVIKDKEGVLRRRCAQTWFPNPEEGVNNLELPDGAVLKCSHTLNRKLDIGVYETLRPEFDKRNVPTDIVVQEPKFQLKVYRELTAEEQAFFDQCLVVEPGMPSLAIGYPKRKPKNLAKA